MMPIASLALVSTDDLDATVERPPELDDDEYIREVLGERPGCTEDDIDRDLGEAAEPWGVGLSELVLSRPSTADGKQGHDDDDDGDADEHAIHDGTAWTTTSHSRPVSVGSCDSVGSLASGDPTTTLSVIPATLTESAASPAPANAVVRSRARSLNFSQYDKYLGQIDLNLIQPKFVTSQMQHLILADRTSLFSVSTRLSVRGIGRNLSHRLRLKRTRVAPAATTTTSISCICCREEFITNHHDLQTLPCGHTYCQNCLVVMVNQSTTDESKMPPRCCTQPIPGSTIKTILGRDEQQVFLKAVLQYSTPWEARVFCPSPACGEFIPPRNKINPRHPFEVVCKTCKTRVCVMCKRNAHGLGQDCPSDWELEAVLKMGEKSGWRRCYKCRTLVELNQGCTHMTCRCKAQFCYICGAVWDAAVGCPNFCNGEEELERRRAEEAARAAELAAEKAAREEAEAVEATERAEAEARTRESHAFADLRAMQEDEMARFQTFEHKARWIMWTRHSRDKLRLVERYAELMDKMRERHAKTEQHLEDRQVEAEIELRHALDNQEKSIHIKLRHMEAYCNALGRAAGCVEDGGSQPSREVTQKNLEQLGQQYHLRDGMARRHQAQINVLREKQSKRMEELTERQEGELDNLASRRADDVDALTARFAAEDEAFARVFLERRRRVRARWRLKGEILRRVLEDRSRVRYAPMDLPDWPVDVDREGWAVTGHDHEKDG